MPFLFPGLLGLCGIAAVPIVIHLLNRQRYRRVPWAAMKFLLDALKDETKKIQYRDILLMMLRALVCLLLAMAIARPVSRFLTEAVGWGAEARSVVIVMDDSASMNLTSGTETVFERAKREALSICRELPSGTIVSVITASKPAEIVIAGSKDMEEVVERIESLEATHGGTDLAGAVRKASRLAEELPSGRAVELLLLTDLQKRVLTKEAELLRSLARDFETGSKLQLVPLGLQGQRNLAVTGLSTELPVVTLGAPVEVEAEITNGGTQAETNVVVEFLVDGKASGSKMITSLGAGESAVRTFYVETDTPGAKLLEAVVERGRGRLSVDDTRRLVVTALDNVKVLLVDGEPSEKFGDGEVDYLDAVLNPDLEHEGRPLKGAFSTSRTAPDDLKPELIADADIVVLANVSSVSDTAAAALEKRVSDGASLLAFLGDQVIPAEYNRLFDSALVREEERKKGEAAAADPAAADTADPQGNAAAPIVPLIPARIGDAMGNADAEEKDWFYLSPEHLDHPWMQFFRAPEMRDYLRVPVRKAYRLDVTAVPGASVVARYTSGEPAVTEQRLGDGRVVLVGTSADLEWNDLPSEPAGPILIKRIATALIPGSGVHRSVNVGQQVRLPVPRDERKLPMKLVRPDDRVRTMKPDVLADKPVIVYDGDGPAGQYRVKIESVPPREELFVMNVDPGESYIGAFEPGDVKDLFPSGEFVLLEEGGSESVGKALRRGRIGAELWWPVLLIGLAVFIVEIVLGRLFTREAPSSEDLPKVARRGQRLGPAGAAVARGRNE